MRIGLDTNVIGYAEGLDDLRRQDRATDILRRLPPHELALPLQAGAEMHRLVKRRRKVDAFQASLVVKRWMDLILVHPPTTPTAFSAAIDLASQHGLQIFDAIIVAAAEEAGCRLLLSEDMQDGFVWRGMTIANPFATELHPMLVDALHA